MTPPTEREPRAPEPPPTRLAARLAVLALALAGLVPSGFILLIAYIGSETLAEDGGVLLFPQLLSAVASAVFLLWAVVLSLSKRQPIWRSVYLLAAAAVALSLWPVLVCLVDCPITFSVLPTALGMTLAAGLVSLGRWTHARHLPQPVRPPAEATEKVSGKAIASLLLGFCGLVIPIVLSLPAIILGFLARGDITAESGLRGRGLANAGLVTGAVGMALGAVAVVMMMLGPNYAGH